MKCVAVWWRSDNSEIFNFLENPRTFFFTLLSWGPAMTMLQREREWKLHIVRPTRMTLNHSWTSGNLINSPSEESSVLADDDSQKRANIIIAEFKSTSSLAWELWAVCIYILQFHLTHSYTYTNSKSSWNLNISCLCSLFSSFFRSSSFHSEKSSTKKKIRHKKMNFFD